MASIAFLGTGNMGAGMDPGQVADALAQSGDIISNRHRRRET